MAIDRRDFLKTAAAVSAGFAGAPLGAGASPAEAPAGATADELTPELTAAMQQWTEKD